MFKKILIANRGESARSSLRRSQSARSSLRRSQSARSPLRRSQSGCEADASAKPNCLVRAAHAGEFPAENQHV